MSFFLAGKSALGGLPSRNIDDYPEGIVVPVDKTLLWTSADVIRRLKWLSCRYFSKKNLKVGHAGTLDPLATGVLLVCIGKATRCAETLQKSDKEYIAGITFGATTPSFDREKDIDRVFPHEHIDEQAVVGTLNSLTGEYEQVAPLFSAKSVDGVRAYEIARKEYKKALAGEAFDHSAQALLHKQMINVYEAQLLEFQKLGVPDPAPYIPTSGPGSRIKMISLDGRSLPRAVVRIRCSKGTYIRAFARDAGEALGSGAFLDSLIRTCAGGVNIADALSMDEAAGLFL